MKRERIPFTNRLKRAAMALLSGTRAGDAADALFTTHEDRYEAANPWTPDRSWIPSYVRDARHDANSWSRWEMCRKIRYFEENVWIVSALATTFQKYTVGPNGIPVTPCSSDKDWNDRMRDSYLEWCEGPCADSRDDMAAVHKMLAREYHIDGEIFVLKTRVKPAGSPSLPRIKLIESHRCSSPGQGFSADDDPHLIDGVALNDDGLPVGYWLRDGILGDEWTYRKASDVIQVFEPHRVGMYRGITGYHAVLNKTHDLDDLDMLEMGRAKQNAEVSYWLKTWNGEIPPSLLRQERGITNRGLGNPIGGLPEGKDGLNKRLLEYSTALGSKVKALKPGEEVEKHESASPTAAQQWYWKYLISQISQARGIPMMLILPESIQGTVTRAVLDDANIYFRSQFRVIAPAVRSIYLYYANWARYNVKGLQDAPADWNRCHLVPPRAVNVDQGRNSAMMLAEWAAGATNLTDIAGDDGTTAENLIRKKADDIVLINQVAAEKGIDPAMISGNIAQILQQLAMANQANALADSAGEEKPEPVEK